MGTKSSTLSEPSVIKNKTDSSLVLKKKISFANGRLVKTLTNTTGFIGHCLGQFSVPRMMQQKNERSTTKGKQHLRTEFPPPLNWVDCCLRKCVPWLRLHMVRLKLLRDRGYSVAIRRLPELNRVPLPQLQGKHPQSAHHMPGTSTESGELSLQEIHIQRDPDLKTELGTAAHRTWMSDSFNFLVPIV